ncbi:MAG: hypothetical protein N0C89_18860 [Candidatus Thiodiazotropha endolucinida]|nr:hypothetical protein [Candidatus Thiodiazotropha taylori]MCG8093118.1 hypothetical protein [Candidatus Thiodiazotropha endolucinida]MCG8061213.1 hypothetical protein [Candidatus Thiodiazotropha taylori]MCG8066178.1 hypothetical protein [Candidatus Thiodiazotropha taylori]MCW4332275.1 hypothetical protein [Candidatus Thiodiazotropha endolucinida]
MIEVSSLVALIVAEVLIGLVVLSGILVVFTLLRKGRIRRAAAHLAERVKTDKAKREQRLKVLLQDRYQYKEAELQQTLHNMMQTEMLLYQNVINGFLKDDQVHLQQIDVDVENLVLGYQGLEVSAPATSSTQTSDSNEEITQLKEENERLSEELRVTMDTMGRMLNEYSTMFAGGADAGQAAAPPSTEETEDSERVDVGAAEAIQEDVEQESVEPSIAESMMDDAPVDDMVSDLASGPDIPDLSAEELEHSSYLEENADSEGQVSEATDATENASLDEDAVEADEEVSEIIDEVMEIADEMIEDSMQTDTQSETGESMVDDLETIDIEIPGAEETMPDINETEAGSLEDEWAKLLEEDAANKKKE